MKVLIVYPHGLGDCILATPAIREYKKQTGNFIGFATLERFRSAELFKNNPYVDEIIYTKDAWNDWECYEEGREEVLKHCHLYAKDNKYDKVVYIQHSPTGSKILDCFAALGIQPAIDKASLFHTEVYLTGKDYESADLIIRNRNKHGFIHSETGVPNKDLPRGYGVKWIAKHFGRIPWYEPVMVTPITKAFALLKQSTTVVVTDSVYYHAAGAMDKDVDLAYFARGPAVYNRVKPLHPVKQNIVYELEKL